MKVKLAEAARLAGVSRSTVHRAMTRGRLSFERDDTGERLVDVAELERVFSLTPPPADTAATVARHVAGHPVQPAETLAPQLEAERAKVAMLEDQVRDLRRRLDASEEERRGLSQRLLGPPEPPAAPPQSWWARWRGRAAR